MFRWMVCEEDRKCCVSFCDIGARHIFVQDFPAKEEVPYCCRHFTAIVLEIYNARDAIYARSTQNALQELERRILTIVKLHQRINQESIRLAREVAKAEEGEE